MYRILQTGAALSLSTASGPASEQRLDWKPQFFSTEQNDTLIALGERIIPGSAGASCNRLIDLIMTVESEKTREELLQAMAMFDNEARKRHQKPFRDLTAEQQDEILTSAVTGGSPLHSQFGVVKEWMADAYWSSEKGLRELGWTGRMAWENFPGCGNPAAHN